MLFNHLKIAWRNFRRQRLNSFIYLGGLSAALACVIFIGLYVQNEKSYDTFLPGHEQIFRVNLDGKMGPEEFLSGDTPPPVGKALTDNFPEIQAYTRLYRCSPENISVAGGKNRKIFTEERLYSADSNFLGFFRYRVLAGSAAEGLADPNSIVITESIARKYFGNAAPVGQELYLDEWGRPFTVRTVLADLPANSSLQFDFLISNEAMPPVKRFEWSWVWLQMVTFVKIHPQSTDPAGIAKLESKLPALVKQQAAGAFEKIGKPFDEFVRNGGRWNLLLQPMADVHLGSKEVYSKFVGRGNKTTVHLFLTTAILILVLACINSMNLTTAQALRRSKEIGVRKVLGSEKSQLIRQFLTESALFTALAMFIAVGLVIWLLPHFGTLTATSFKWNALFSFFNFGILVALGLLTGLLSGLYPAIYLTSFKPAASLKSRTNPTSFFSGRGVRDGLVVFQFTVATALIICSTIIYSQLRYTQNLDLGFEKEQVVVLAQAEKLGENAWVLVQEIRKVPGVKSASLSTGLPAGRSFGDFYVPEPSISGPEVVKDIALNSFMVDDEYMKTLDLQLLTGRAFDRDFNDSTSVLLNETAVRQIGWTADNAVGQHLTYPGNANQRFRVIGVVRDFHTESLHTPVMPFALFHFASHSYRVGHRYISLKLEAGQPSGLLGNISQKWDAFSADVPFSPVFLDESVNALYQADKRAGITFGLFTLLSVLIGCIGLLGLISATVQQRFKEIGVRKVLGASTTAIIRLLSADFVKLVLLALLLACPLAWWVGEKWLEDFVYKTEITWWMFVAAAALSLAMALLTVAWQAFRAAMVNPVQSLRSE